jgi:hypothetical protein
VASDLVMHDLDISMLIKVSIIVVCISLMQRLGPHFEFFLNIWGKSSKSIIEKIHKQAYQRPLVWSS